MLLADIIVSYFLDFFNSFPRTNPESALFSSKNFKTERLHEMFEKFKKLLIDNFGIKESDVLPEAKLVDDLGINSLELADLTMLCEDTFGIEIKDDEYANFITVEDVVNYLTKAVEKK